MRHSCVFFVAVVFSAGYRMPSASADEWQYPVIFEGPSRDMDTFEIAMPTGYEVDDLPPPVNAEFSFASYHSKAEVSGNVLRYTRTFEVKEPSVPLAKIGDLKMLYRIIANDERNTAVLKPAGPASAKN